MGGVRQRIVRERRGEMFERAGRGELLDRRAALDPRDRPSRAFLGRCDGEAGVLGPAVERDMFGAVHRLLIEEIVECAAQRPRPHLEALSHRRPEQFSAETARDNGSGWRAPYGEYMVVGG